MTREMDARDGWRFQRRGDRRTPRQPDERGGWDGISASRPSTIPLPRPARERIRASVAHAGGEVRWSSASRPGYPENARPGRSLPAELPTIPCQDEAGWMTAGPRRRGTAGRIGGRQPGGPCQGTRRVNAPEALGNVAFANGPRVFDQPPEPLYRQDRRERGPAFPPIFAAGRVKRANRLASGTSASSVRMAFARGRSRIRARRFNVSESARQNLDHHGHPLANFLQGHCWLQPCG